MEQKTKDLMLAAMNCASHIFANLPDDEILCPVWMIEDTTGECHIIATPWECPEDKEKTAAMLRGKMREFKAVRYAFVSESWMLDIKDGALPQSIQLGASLASHPDKVEVIQVAGEDKTGTGMMSRQILRPGHGKKTLAPAQWWPDGDNEFSAGRFANMLADSA